MMKESARLIEALRSPLAYDHSVEQVEVLETHISWVLLAGEFAYKIKKPVRLEFVDFSTLERRRHFCYEELRLNRRLAPMLYLAVLPISGAPDGPKINGPGAPQEWTVQMRRFPQEALLARLVEQDRLTQHHIDQLARRVAEFHSQIAIADASTPWGSWDKVTQPIEENFNELLSAVPPGRDLHERLATLQQRTNEKLASLQEAIVARKQNGFIRECHGDMHLGNIVLLDGEVVVFDGIEFNENLRWIDIQNEIAFPIMDLDQRGRPDLARRLLNLWLEASGDYEGLLLLPLYLGYRALVRAKIDWIRAQQAGLTDQTRGMLEEKFQRYLSLAEHYAQPPQPRLFLTHGVSGSGKSYFARQLAETFGAVQIRSDVERKRLAETVKFDNLYSPEATEATYARLERLSAAALKGGFSVIADATFLARSRREQFRRLAERVGTTCTILDFQASPEVLRERIVARRRAGEDASDADLSVLALQMATREPLTDDELARTIVVDSEAATWRYASLFQG